MTKQRINLCIDWDVYLSIKEQDINISNLVNEILRGMLTNNYTGSTEQETKMRIAELKIEIEETNKTLMSETIKLASINARHEQQIKDAEESQHAIRQSGILRQI